MMNKDEKLFDIEPTLIVTGNGFDLNCDLESSYEGFYKWCSNNVKGFSGIIEIKDNVEKHFENIIEFYRNSENKQLTVWDLYLILHSNPEQNQWFNIEELIYESIEIKFWDVVFSEVEFFLQDKHGITGIKELLGKIICDRYFVKWNELIPGKPKKAGTFEFSKEIFYIKLLEELNVFEKRFGKYIEERLQKTEKYFEKQSDLIKKLIRSTSKSIPYKIVSFNYTPYKKTREYLNIHGTYEKPIFGISREKSTHEYSQMFTKPFRRIVNNLDRIERFIGGDYSYVVFYGASLSELDLDHYKLILEKKAIKKIYFCYSEYDGPERRVKFIRAVYNLIEKIFPGQIYELYDNKEVIEIVKI